MNEIGCVITTDFSQEVEDAIGKFVIAPTQKAQELWEQVRNDPTGYSFAFGYIEDKETGKKELMEISLIPRVKNYEQTPNS
jgi:hypothetical protein